MDFFFFFGGGGGEICCTFLGDFLPCHIELKDFWFRRRTGRFRKIEMSCNFPKKRNKHLICSLCGGIFDSCNKTAPNINHQVVLDGYGTEYLKQQSFGRTKRQRYSITWWLGGHLPMIWYDLIVVFGIYIVYLYMYQIEQTHSDVCDIYLYTYICETRSDANQEYPQVLFSMTSYGNSFQYD